MTHGADVPLARRIASLMRVGTAAAAVLLTVGAVGAYLRAGPAAGALLGAGCGVVVLLPVARLAMVAGHFARLSHRRLVLTTVAVLALVLAGGVAGMVL